MREPTVVITDLYATYPAEALEVLERAGVAIINAEALSEFISVISAPQQF